MIYDDYIDLSATYQAKYGDRTTIFMQVGDFYEIYGVDAETDVDDVTADGASSKPLGADIRRVCDLCNLQMTRKNKALEPSRKNPYMAGFPLYILQKHIQTLVCHGDTVVVIQQTTPPPNPKREVTGIYSPSTLLTPTAPDSPYLMTLYWTSLGTDIGKAQLGLGIACVDVSTGKTMVYETASQRDMPNLAEDEAVRWIAAFAPREIVLFGRLPPPHQRRVTALVEGAAASATVHAAWATVPPEFERPTYQASLFALAYPDESHNMGTDLHLYALARAAFAYLIQFAHDHNELLVRRLDPPTFLAPSRHLHLQTNAVQQLNVVGALGEKSLLALLNRCATAFGGRLFKDRLLHPIHDVDELERRYAAVERLMKEDAYVAIHKALTNVNDLERMARRLALQQFAPMEWPNLERSVTFAARAADAAGVVQNFCADALRDWLAQTTAALDVDECAKYTMTKIEGNVFRRGVYADLDALTDALEQRKKEIEDVAAAWSAAAEGDATLCRVDVNDREGWHIVTTKKRWEVLLKKEKIGAVAKAALPPSACTTRAISASSANVRVAHATLTALSDAILDLQRQMATQATAYYKDFLATTGVQAAGALAAFVPALAELDVHATHARNATAYGYVRPQPAGPTAAPGLAIRGLRHPIIERVQQDVSYVPNSVDLGGATAPTGWLLFGMNAAGKSSLMKSIGLAVMMAQAGMFVPATSMTFTPYHHIFTRISSGDNIYRGMSTFVVEMIELRNILQRCTDRSLVLGDELCAGTEAVSGVAIVGAGVEWLAAKRATFVFATHLHELADLPGVRALTEPTSGLLRVCHMHVDVEEDGTIVYERSVKDGMGHRTYGLEVCRGLGLPDAFLAAAEATRRSLLAIPDKVVPPKASRYSRKVLVHKCGVCGAAATETHHIVYQKDAGGNQPSNLVPLCESCHHDEHTGKISIQGYRATSRGIKLQVRRAE